ncbi:tetratricopeptide repeat protein [Kamptonema animale CS-326]|jgi:cytochrome c-type biogenesis protein CcmH/NrfG|uniref:tetratricopeptide repeat protein n=1 Tax=Kamptonema animale TaxID=92934 RepID=UPI00232AFED6|nr:tetratricopeptide repeat protein [Kamptonema animale]MDB9513571.1 tetratricopeptide repeat protein [Kamptonema animale CS-326]
MEGLGKKYNKAREMRSQRVKQIFVLVSIVSFAGSTAFGIGKLFLEGLNRPRLVPAQTAKALSLADEERGYELVLQREPENQTALEGLADVRMQMGNNKGAVEPLEKLVKLHRDRADYKVLLGRVKGK